MIFVLILSWIRFFSYFLVINSIAKITITLFKMVEQALIFLIIMISYMLMAMIVFATLFNSANTAEVPEFTTMAGTFRALCDMTVANYN